MFKFIGALPQPLRALYIAFFPVFVLGFVSVLLRLGETARWALGGIGLVAVLIGLCLVLNINGAARGAARALKDYRPAGVDYSRSFLSSPAYARLFGAFFTVVGAAFLAQSVMNPDFGI